MKRRGFGGLAVLVLVLAASAAPAEMLPGSPQYIDYWIERDSPYLRSTTCANGDCPGYRRLHYLKWEKERPDELRCSGCATVYPSDKYPEDQVWEHDGHRLIYHQSPSGTYHYFIGAIRSHKAHHAMGEMVRLSRLYAKGGDVAHAQQARDILLGFAQRYPQWLLARGIHDGREPLLPAIPGERGPGRLQHYFADYNITGSFIEAYRNIEPAGIISPQQYEQIRTFLEAHVEQSLFAYFRLHRITFNVVGRFFLSFAQIGTTFPDLEIRDLVHEHFHGEPRTLRGPDLVEQTLGGDLGIEALIANSFYRDGFYFEGSLSYQEMILRSIAPFIREVQGYSDPVAYQPQGRSRYDDYHLPVNGRLRAGLVALPKLTFPDGQLLPLADSTKIPGRDFLALWRDTVQGLVPEQEIVTPQQSDFFDGIGVAALRCGSDRDASAAFLIYGPRGGGHSHYDQLSLTYYALGHELVTDLGYPDSADPLRHTWINRAAGHNTVVVDGQNQQMSRGQLEVFAAGDRFRIVQARSSDAYPQLEDYRRTLILVGDGDDDDAHPRYLVDVFHVIGGRMHDYALHAQSEPDATRETFTAEQIELTPHDDPATTLLALTPGALPRQMGYDHIDHLRLGASQRPWLARWEMPGERPLSLRVHRLPIGQEQVIVGEAPGHRLRGTPAADHGRMMTWLAARRSSEEQSQPLRSTFVSVIEACPGDAARIRSVRRIELEGPAPADAVGIEVVHDAGADLFIVARAPGRFSSAERQLQLEGRIAAVSITGSGEVQKVAIADGDLCRIGGTEVWTSRPAKRGKVVAVRDGVSESPLLDRPLIVEVEREVPYAGEIIHLRHADSSRSAWRITHAERLVGDITRLTLDGSACEGIGRIDHVSPDGSSVFTNSGRFVEGAWLVVDDRWLRVTSHRRMDLSRPYINEVRIEPALPDPQSMLGRRIFTTRIAVGDEYELPGVVHWSRD